MAVKKARTNKELQTSKKKQNNYRLQTKQLFLTYPRCAISLESAFVQLKLILDTYGLEKYLLVQEDHTEISEDIKSPKIHLHVYIKLRKRFSTRNPNFLDLVGDDHKNFHGNYQKCKQESQTIGYLTKDIITFKDAIISDNLKCAFGPHGEVLSLDETLISLSKEGKLKEALNLLEKEDPKLFLRQGDKLKKRFKNIFADSKIDSPLYEMSSFDISDEVDKNLKTAYENKKSIIFLGASGIGKTRIMRTFTETVLNLKPLVINNIDSLREFDNDKHNCIIFDDCNFLDANREQIIILLDSENAATFPCRYENVRIDSNVLRVLIHNKTLYEILPKRLSEDPAIQRRIFIHNCGTTSLIRKKK